MVGAQAATDAELARRARAGSGEHFAALVQRYQGRLFRFLRLRVGGCRQDAEDVLQDTFTRCWRGLPGYDPARPFAAWLFRIAANAAVSRARRSPPPASVGECDAAAGEPGPDEHAARRDAHRNLWDVALRELSTDARSALWLFYVEDRTAAEIGDILGKREGAVRVMLMRARTRLADALPRAALSLEEP